MWALVIGGGALLTVDLMFVAANLTKLLHGAWLPLLVGLVVFTVMTTWQRGQQIAAAARDTAEGRWSISSTTSIVASRHYRASPGRESF